MANLSESTTWEAGIYQLETTDPVQGGPTGIANQQAKQLANRTSWLKSKIGGYDGISTLTSDGNPFAIPVESLNKIVILNNDDISDLDVDLPSGVAGNTIGFYYNSSAVPGNTAIVGGVTLNIGDLVEFLYTAANTTIVTNITRANEFDTINPIGSVLLMAGNTPPAGYLAMNGATLNRNTYRRLWAHAQASGMLAANATDKTNNPGKFGRGDGATTFALPDLRGEFIRGWDNGRGLDNSIVLTCTLINASTNVSVSPNTTGLSVGMAVSGTGIQPGTTIVSIDSSFNITISAPATTAGFQSITFGRGIGTSQADELKAHTHSYGVDPIAGTGNGTKASDGSNIGGIDTTNSTGGTETRPRNVALLYCIKF